MPELNIILTRITQINAIPVGYRRTMLQNLLSIPGLSQNELDQINQSIATLNDPPPTNNGYRITITEGS
jgi:hypothetical protein